MRSYRSRRALQITLAAGVALGAAQMANAAVTIHLAIPGIEGESTDADNKNKIAVLAFEETIGGKKSCPEYAITKFVDKSSPPLTEAANKGSSLASATLTMRRSGEGQKDFYKLTMLNVSVLGVQKVVPGADSGIGIEKLIFSPKVAETAYRPQDEKGGLGPEVKGTVSCP